MSNTRSKPTVARYRGAKSKSVRMVILRMSDGFATGPPQGGRPCEADPPGPPNVDLGKVVAPSRPPVAVGFRGHSSVPVRRDSRIGTGGAEGKNGLRRLDRKSVV